MIAAKYDYISHRREWLGVIYEERGLRRTVLIVGCELTEAAIKNWIDLTIRNAPWDGGDFIPDLYDRKRKAH